MNTQPEAIHEVNGELADKLIAKSDQVIELEILNQELLEALKLITEVGDRSATEIARAAIAKATN